MLRRTLDLEVANDLSIQLDIPYRYVDGIFFCIDLDYNSVDAVQILGRLSIILHEVHDQVTTIGINPMSNIL